jgi:hypothetical protein
MVRDARTKKLILASIVFSMTMVGLIVGLVIYLIMLL